MVADSHKHKDKHKDREHRHREHKKDKEKDRSPSTATGKGWTIRPLLDRVPHHASGLGLLGVGLNLIDIFFFLYFKGFKFKNY